MNDIIFEVLKLAVMIAAFAVMALLIPWLKNKIGTDKVEQITDWAKQAVLFAQQTMWKENGEDRKSYVVKFVEDMCDKYHINITDEQIDILIEAAVKQMKIDQGVVYNADKGKSTSPKTNGEDSVDTGKAKE